MNKEFNTSSGTGYDTKGRPIINVDMDNVVYPFMPVLAEFIESRGVKLPRYSDGNRKGEILYDHWAFWEDWNMSTGEYMSWFRRAVEEGVLWHTGPAIEGASEFLWKLSDAEYYIRILTHSLVHPFGHKHAVAGTHKWLEEYNIPYRSFVMLGDGDSKANYTAKLLIDDSLRNLSEVTSKGQLGILFNSPHNIDDDTSQLDNIFSAESWEEVYKLVLKHVPNPFIAQKSK